MTLPGPVPGARTGWAPPTRSADQAVPASPATGALPNATGHPEVDAVLALLVDIADAPPAEQVALYAEAHRALQQTLRAIDAT